MVNITAANAVLTKSRCMYGKALTAADYESLAACRSVSEVAFYLKTRTHYANALSGLDEGTVHRTKLEERLSYNQYEEFSRLCRYEFSKDEGFSEYIVMESEIKQLLHFLRLLSVGRTSEYILTVPGYIASRSSVDFYALSHAKSFADFAKALSRSRYRKAVAPFLNMETPDFALVEHALFGCMFSALVSVAEKRKIKEEKEELCDIFCSLLDIRNFLNIYRLKKYYNADESTIKTLLFANSHKLKKATVQAMLAAPSGEAVLEIIKGTCYGKYFNTDAKTVDAVFNRVKYNIAKKYIHYSVNPSVVMISYVMLSQVELTNLTDIIECVRYGLPADEITKMITV